MRNGIIVCRLSLIKTYLLAFQVLRKFRDSAPLRVICCQKGGFRLKVLKPENGGLLLRSS